MDEHRETNHGSFKCKKCEYSASDKEIMSKHMANHTGRIIFTCVVCEFEATRQAILEKHVKMRHKKKNVLPKLPPLMCKKCEKSYPDIFLFSYHTCSPETKFACQSCTFRAITLPELLAHVESHVRPVYPCSYCGLKATNQRELLAHIEDKHSKQTSTCSYCDFKTEDETTLKTHLVTKHEDSAMITVVANQQTILNEAMFALSNEMGEVLSSIAQGQNEMRSEIMLLREEVAFLRKEQTSPNQSNKNVSPEEIFEELIPKKQEEKKTKPEVTNPREKKKQEPKKTVEHCAVERKEETFGKDITVNHKASNPNFRNKPIKNIVWV